MQNTFRVTLVGTCFILTFLHPDIAQNLLTNSGFEDINICTEFTAPCAPKAWKEVNYGRTYFIHNNKGGKVGVLLSNVSGMRTYISTEVLCPLEAGETYIVNFDLNLRGMGFIPFGMLLSTEDFSGRFNSKTVQPTLVFTKNNSLKKIKNMDWIPFEGRFQATGKERFLYVGYFDTGLSTGKRDWMQIIYLDNFKLTPVDKSIVPCPEFDAKRAELYADNLRHGGVTDTVDVIHPETKIKTDSATSISEHPTIQPEKIPVPPLDTLFLSGVCFAFNKSTLNNYYAVVTDSLINAIFARNPKSVVISGHTDNIGTEDFNRKLSLARAQTIGGLLIQKGFGAEKIRYEGFGETRPVAPNETEQGRARNRRIEVVLIF